MDKPFFRFSGIFIIPLLAILLTFDTTSAQSSPAFRIGGHIPEKVLKTAQKKGRMVSGTSVSLAISLPPKDIQALSTYIGRLYTPGDPLYGKFLSVNEYTEKFGPSQSDYDAVCAYARNQGFTITRTYRNRSIVNVAAPVSTVEKAFNLSLNTYTSSDGRTFFAPDNNPAIPAAMKTRIAGIIGLDNANVRHRFSSLKSLSKSPNATSAYGIGSGPFGGLTPSDIKTAYNLDTVTADGTGQIMAIIAFNSYSTSDIAHYISTFNLPSVTVQNKVVYQFQSTSDASEETLDIELQIASAPGASKIIVYQTQNSDAGMIEAFNQMASDNLASQISICWGSSEDLTSSSTLESENTALMEMAAQGQAVFVASGDRGAYDNGYSLSVDDPGSQPYVTSVGGTNLSLNGDGTYAGETTWNSGTISGGAGGGGISGYWSLPSWQSGIGTLSSSSKRNIPDVSLHANPNTGFAVYYKGNWWLYGGTSCAAPVWTGFYAIVNQIRVQNGLSVLGFANPKLYELAAGSAYATLFHDIADNSDNLYYVAGTGYDNATGLGSFNGANLFAELTTVTSAPPTPEGVSISAGNRSVTLSWNQSTGATSYKIYRATTSGGEGGTPLASGITSLTYTDSTAASQTPYYYKVSALNSYGESSLSSEVSATIIPIPDVPTGITVTESNLALVLTWTGSSDTVSYSVYRGTSSGGEGASPIATGITENTYTDSDVSSDAIYYYKITATNTFGTSAKSGEASGAITPGTPTNLKAAGSSSGITLSWTAGLSNASFSVYRGTVSGGEGTTPIAAGITDTSYIDSTSASGVRYYYTVTASNSSGVISATSAEVSGVRTTTSSSSVSSGTSGGGGGGCFIGSLYQ